MTQSSGKSPNLECCAARQSGAADLVFCLTEHRTSCGYALPFGQAFFCRHPDAHGIAARTTAPGDESKPGE